MDQFPLPAPSVTVTGCVALGRPLARTRLLKCALGRRGPWGGTALPSGGTPRGVPGDVVWLLLSHAQDDDKKTSNPSGRH